MTENHSGRFVCS